MRLPDIEEFYIELPALPSVGPSWKKIVLLHESDKISDADAVSALIVLVQRTNYSSYGLSYCPAWRLFQHESCRFDKDSPLVRWLASSVPIEVLVSASNDVCNADFLSTEEIGLARKIADLAIARTRQFAR